MKQGFPSARAGQVIGLLGGSFDPAHDGHVHITREALKRLGLDRVWWLVSPGNPLKTRGPAPLADRVARAREVIDHPQVTITALEARLGTRYTYATLTRLTALYPGTRFVWLMGADNLAAFHNWENWRDIMGLCPIAVLARPGERISARMSMAARVFRHNRLHGRAPRALKQARAPAWIFLNVPLNDLSSTRIRAQGNWSRP